MINSMTIAGNLPSLYRKRLTRRVEKQKIHKQLEHNIKERDQIKLLLVACMSSLQAQYGTVGDGYFSLKQSAWEVPKLRVTEWNEFIEKKREKKWSGGTKSCWKRYEQRENGSPDVRQNQGNGPRSTEREKKKLQCPWLVQLWPAEEMCIVGFHRDREEKKVGGTEEESEEEKSGSEI